MLYSPANNSNHKPQFLVKYANISNKHIFVNMAPIQRNIYLYSYQADLETYALVIALEFFFFFSVGLLLFKKSSVLQNKANTDGGSVDQSEIILL